VARCAGVPQERLTRHEISWLLAQEARGAAKTLRTEVQELRAPGEVRPTPAPVQTTLDALDDTIEMLSALNAERRGRGRRGRIDLAALLCEIAPSARIAIEPGSGTEVFGDEAELRRMLHLLVGQFGSNLPTRSEAEITIRRQGDFVRISTNLGPDTTALGELEHRWLSRMALRHGGTIELEGGTQSIVLQADGASDQREVTELKKELAEAQQLGEAYARELASIFTSGEIRTEAPPPGARDPGRFEGVRSMCAAVRRALRGIPAAQELVLELGAVADVQLDEAPTEIDLGASLSQAARALDGRASRSDVELVVQTVGPVGLKRPKGLVELLVKSLLFQAIAATPRGGQVLATAMATELGPALAVSDGGPAIPEASRQDILRHRIDPTSLGRPAGIALVVADATAAVLDVTLEVREDGGGRVEFWIVLPKS
jgi:two-component system, OmpR family, sensor kinase